MKEYIEMDTKPQPSTSFAKPPPPPIKTYTFSESSPALVEKVLRREYELRPFTTNAISYIWVILPVFCYFGVLVGGIMTSIGVGNVYAAFDYYCIFKANFTLHVIILRDGNKTLRDFTANSWGDGVDCLFAEYGSVALALFSGVWIVMVLQCGRGGASKRGFRLPDAWRIVPPTCVLNTTVFIISCIILSNVSSGYNTFCENAIIQYEPPDENSEKMSCPEILGFRYGQMDKFNTNLVKESNVSEFGAAIQFVGCLVGFIVVILRCCTGPDFDLYVKREIAYIPANTDEEKGFGEGIFEEDEDYDEEEFQDCRDNGDHPPSPLTLTRALVITHPQPSSLVDNPEEEISDGSITSRTGLILS